MEPTQYRILFNNAFNDEMALKKLLYVIKTYPIVISYTDIFNNHILPQMWYRSPLPKYRYDILLAYLHAGFDPNKDNPSLNCIPAGILIKIICCESIDMVDTKCIELLLSYGANANELFQNQSPLELIAEMAMVSNYKIYIQIMRLLISYGTNTDVPSDNRYNNRYNKHYRVTLKIMISLAKAYNTIDKNHILWAIDKYQLYNYIPKDVFDNILKYITKN